MDKIIIQVLQDEKQVNLVHLQNSALAAGKDLNTLKVAEQSAEFQAAFNAFIALCAPLAPVKPAEVFDVVVAISNDKTEATITRTASCNIPSRPEPMAHVLEMPVIVKHFRNGVYIKNEKADFIDILRVSNDNKRVVDGVEVGDLDYFRQAWETTPLPAIIRGQLAEEDALGRFDK